MKNISYKDGKLNINKYSIAGNIDDGYTVWETDKGEDSDTVYCSINLEACIAWCLNERDDFTEHWAYVMSKMANADEDEDDYNDELSYRIIFDSFEEQQLAQEILDKNGDDYDYDSGDRMMVNKSGLDTLYDAGVEFDEV